MKKEFTKAQMVALIDAMNDRPIAFNRHYVSLGCGITGSLMLSQMMYWSKRTQDKNGFFYKTQEDWEEETGLTRREQETARKRLKQLGFVTEHKHGVPCKVHFKVEHEAIHDALIQYVGNAHFSMAESAKLECQNPPNKNDGIRQTNTENTTESTTENKHIYKAKFSFSNALLELGADQQLVSDFLQVRKNKKAADTETAFKSFITQQQKSGLSLNAVLEMCVVRDWKGFQAAWIQNQNQVAAKKPHQYGQGFDQQNQMRDVGGNQ
jgi:hypothetical protein